MFAVFRTEELMEFYNEVKFWSNVYGDLREDGQKSITEEELPPLLRRAYKEVCDGFLESSCYLVEYKGLPYIALSSEFDGNYAEEMGTDVEGLFKTLFHKAYELVTTYKHCHVILIEGSGLCDNGHEIVTLINPSITKEEFIEIADKMKEMFFEGLQVKQEDETKRNDILILGVGNGGEDAWCSVL